MGNKISILLVEDNKLARKMSVIILEQLNCKVEAVSTGKCAIERISRSNYDVIFMDIGLPDMSGLTVIHHIRKNSGLNDQVPIIALTAHSDKEYIEESYKMGATEFLVKPLNKDIGHAILERYGHLRDEK